jgi:cellulose synthase/poly-beta-1,6-N-acetylglucosamine synthase-like glycosyltransferase
MATTVFWVCAAALVYAYAGYPLVIWLASRRFGRRPEPPACGDDDLPAVTLLVAAYNEEEVIGDWLQNAMRVDYPRDRLEVLVGSDGSDDGTAAAVAGYAGRGVRLLDYARRRGKASVLNSLLPEARGEVVVLTDANTQVDPGAVRRLARWFRDPGVGAVCGRLVLVDAATGRNSDGVYWKYETFLKRCEARLGALLGANGAIYAIRRSCYVPIPDGTIIDDFVIPLLSRLKYGCSTVYDDQAFAREESAPGVGAEFHRRSRIGAGGFQSLGLLWKYLDPRRGWVAFAFASHKLLRWVCPFFMIGLFGASLALWESPFYRACLLAQAAFYLLAVLGPLVPARPRVFKPVHVAGMFTAMNAALLVGFCRWARQGQSGAWRRTARAKPGGGLP